MKHIYRKLVYFQLNLYATSPRYMTEKKLMLLITLKTELYNRTKIGSSASHN